MPATASHQQSSPSSNPGGCVGISDHAMSIAASMSPRPALQPGELGVGDRHRHQSLRLVRGKGKVGGLGQPGAAVLSAPVADLRGDHVGRDPGDRRRLR